MILFIDILCPYGHKTFNTLTLSALKSLKEKEVLFIGSKRCINDVNMINNEIPKKFLSNDNFKGFFSKFKYRIVEFKKYIWLLKLIKKYNPDLIFISSYETITFSIISHFIPFKILVFNHNNIDELDDYLKRIFFRFISKNVVHIVFEEYIKEYLEKEIKVNNKIIILPHIVEEREILNNNFVKTKDMDFLILFAPSNGNDMNNIEMLIKNQELLLEKKIYLISKYKYNLQGKSFLLKKYFSDSEYENFMRICTAVYVPFKLSYNYRVSNVINDAVSYGRPIISSINKYTSFLNEKYPSLIYLIKENIIKEKSDILEWIEKSSVNFYNERVRFLKEHSMEYFVRVLNTFINGD
jgi:UDP-N-acetylglucosamine:LPS N-acetylglucosamine transferase